MATATRFTRPLSAAVALTKWSDIVRLVFPNRNVSFTLNTDVDGVSLRFAAVQGKLISQQPTTEFINTIAKLTTPPICIHVDIQCIDGPPHGNERPRVQFSLVDGGPGQVNLLGFGTSQDEFITALNAISSALTLMGADPTLLQSSIVA